MEIPEGLKWIIGTVISLATLGGTLFGVSKLAEMRAARKYAKQDKDEELHRTNYGKQVDAETSFKESLLKRVEKLEADYKEMTEKYTSQAIENARVQTENGHLKDELKKAEKQIESLTTKNEKLQTDLVNANNRIRTLESDSKRINEEIAKIKQGMPKV